MEYKVRCECSAELSVTQAQAGGTCVCECGAVVDVPRLSELRLAAGQSRHPTSAVERVRGMLKRGELPSNQGCPICGNQGDEIVTFGIQCEHASSTDSQDHGILAVAIFGWIGALATALRPQHRMGEIHGHEVRVEVPLRVCSQCVGATGSRTRRRSLRKYLCTVPAYREVFDEYPNAVVNVVQTNT
jgi:hypothetical protein